ncbi:hypothetical protein A3K73_08880 [Candidatus Pacearchaeota archaeon RBG_13_36_9]|nr:MAG: hypothetical protein A3K73_08880 [Candidatus Pacearchaeota archaeon RBG_13_36_9]HJX50358.1 hypothetical protein [Candidatus Nanoarchaeia archaeon]
MTLSRICEYLDPLRERVETYIKKGEYESAWEAMKDYKEEHERFFSSSLSEEDSELEKKIIEKMHEGKPKCPKINGPCNKKILVLDWFFGSPFNNGHHGFSLHKDKASLNKFIKTYKAAYSRKHIHPSEDPGSDARITFVNNKIFDFVKKSHKGKGILIEPEEEDETDLYLPLYRFIKGQCGFDPEDLYESRDP